MKLEKLIKYISGPNDKVTPFPADQSAAAQGGHCGSNMAEAK